MTAELSHHRFVKTQGKTCSTIKTDEHFATPFATTKHKFSVMLNFPMRKKTLLVPLQLSQKKAPDNADA